MFILDQSFLSLLKLCIIYLEQNWFQMQVIVIKVTGGKTGSAITFNRRLYLHQIDSVYGLVPLVPCKTTNR